MRRRGVVEWFDGVVGCRSCLVSPGGGFSRIQIDAREFSVPCPLVVLAFFVVFFVYLLYARCFPDVDFVVFRCLPHEGSGYP